MIFRRLDSYYDPDRHRRPQLSSEELFLAGRSRTVAQATTTTLDGCLRCLIVMICTMPDGNLDVSELHDARFLSLDLDWRIGDVRLRFELDDGSWRIPMAGTPTPLAPKQAGPASLTVRAAIDVETSRVFEWGPSDYVNDATWILDDDKDSGALRIEMQSGDVFVIQGRTLEAVRG